MSSSPSRPHHNASAEASSSRGSPLRQPYTEDANSDDEMELLDSDPLHADIGAKYVDKPAYLLNQC